MTLDDLIKREKEGKIEGMYTPWQIPNEVYHDPRCPGISSSQLKLFLKYPALYDHVYNKGNIKEPTENMIIGSAYHDAVLLPEVFKERYTSDGFAYALGSRNSNKYKYALADYKEKNPRVTIIKENKWDEIEAMLHSTRGSTLASAMITKGKKEMTYFWKDPETGILCKCRPDIVWEDKKYRVEVKTIDDIDSFEKRAADLGYDFQDAFYSWGLEVHYGEPYRGVFMVVEKEPPHGIRYPVLHPDDVKYGRDCFRYALDTYADCVKSNKWPKYTVNGEETFEVVRLPGWRKKQKFMKEVAK